MNKVQELELALEKEKIKQSELKWQEVTKEIIEFLDKLKNYDFYQSAFANQPKKNLFISRIREIKNDGYYLDTQGAYGQWSKKRFISVLCNTYSIGTEYLPAAIFSTGEEGNVLHNDKYQILHETPISLLEEGKGFPLGPKKSWSAAYDRIIQTGTYNLHTSSFSFGERAINQGLEGWKELQTSFYNFKNSIGIVTDKSVFDAIHNTYIQQCKQSKELFDSIRAKEGLFIRAKDL